MTYSALRCRVRRGVRRHAGDGATELREGDLGLRVGNARRMVDEHVDQPVGQLR